MISLKLTTLILYLVIAAVVGGVGSQIVIRIVEPKAQCAACEDAVHGKFRKGEIHGTGANKEY